MKLYFFFGDLLIKKSINLLKILVSVNSGRMIRVRTLVGIYVRI
jgi:hypothetical protein